MHTERRFVYVLKTVSAPSRYYIGLSSNPTARLAEHNEGICRHTNTHRPWRLHVVVEFADELTAARFETYLKSGSGRAFARRHFDAGV